MATEQQLKHLAVKALQDQDFRLALRLRPTETAAAEGIEFTPEQLARIEGTDWSALDEIAANNNYLKIGRAAWADSSKWPWDWAKQLDPEA
jgi:hypothetical protein